MRIAAVVAFVVGHAGAESLPLQGGGWRRRRRVGVPLGVCGGTPTRIASRSDRPLSGGGKVRAIFSACMIASAAFAAIPAAAQTLDKVTFGTNWVAEAEHGGFYQALADGTYKRYGL